MKIGAFHVGRSHRRPSGPIDLINEETEAAAVAVGLDRAMPFQDDPT